MKKMMIRQIKIQNVFKNLLNTVIQNKTSKTTTKKLKLFKGKNN